MAVALLHYRREMNCRNTTILAAPLLKRAVALLFLLLFLGIHAVATEHSLHKKLHHDAGAAHHECVFVQFSAGHCLDTVPPVLLPAPVLTVCVSAPVVEFVFFSHACPILPGRAPPVSPA